MRCGWERISATQQVNRGTPGRHAVVYLDWKAEWRASVYVDRLRHWLVCAAFPNYHDAIAHAESILAQQEDAI